LIVGYFDDDRLSRLPNLRIYGVIKAVISVMTPTMGKIAEFTPATA
jgi:hypothetical protein